MADLYYYESGYIDSSYFVYTADAESAISSSATLTVAVGVIKESTATLQVNCSITATISNQKGADLFAFTEAQIAVQVSVIRTVNTAMSSNFSVAVDAVRGIYVSAQADSTATISVGNSRIRFNQAAIDAAFSLATDVVKFRRASSDFFVESTISIANTRLKFFAADTASEFSVTADVTMVPGGEVLEGAAALQSLFEINAKGTRKTNIIDADVTVVTALGATANRLRGIDELLEVTAIMTAIGSRTRDIDLVSPSFANLTAELNTIKELAAAVSAQATQSTTNGRIRFVASDISSQADLTTQANKFLATSAGLNSQATLSATTGFLKEATITCESLFTPSITCNAVTNTFAVLDSVSSLTISISVTKSYAVNIESSSTVSATGQRIRFANSSQASEFTQTTAINLTTLLAAGLTSSATVVIDNSRTRNVASDLSASASQSTAADRFRASAVTLTVQADLTCQTGFLKSGSIDCSALFTPSITCNAITNTFAVLDSVASVSAAVNRTRTTAVSISSAVSLSVSTSVTKPASAAMTVQATIADSTFGNSNILGIIRAAEATLKPIASLTAIGTFQGKRPRFAQNVSSGIVVSSAQSVVGGASLYVPGTSGTGIGYQSSNDYVLSRFQTFNIELFVRFTGYTGNTNRQIIGTGADNESGWSIELSSTNRLQFRTRSISPIGITSTFTPSTGVWYYIRVYRDANRLVNLDTATLTGSTWSSITNRASGSIDTAIGSVSFPSRIQMGYTTIQAHFDEVYIAYGTTTKQQFLSGTTPNRITAGADSTTIALFHYDTDLTDDLTGIKQFQAALSAQATQTTLGSRIRFGSSTATAQAVLTADGRKFGNVTAEAQLASTSALSVIGNGTVRIEADLASEGFLITAVGRIVPETAALDVTSALTASLNKKYSGQAALTATASLTATALDLDIASATLTATASLTASARRTRNLTSAITAQAILTAEADRVCLQLFYGASETSGYITSDGLEIYDPISGDSEGFHAVWTNFWFKTGRALTLGETQFIYISGSDTKPADWPWPNNHYSNSRNWILIGRDESTGEYYLDVKTVIKRVSPINQYQSDGLYDFLHTAYRTKITLPIGFNPTRWHNFHIPIALGAWMIPPTTGGSSTYNTIISDTPAVDGVAASYSIGISPGEATYLNAGPYEAPSLFVPIDGGKWGAANNTCDLFIDDIWVKSSATGTDRSQYTAYSISQFWNTSTGISKDISDTGVNSAGIQAQVWLPFQELTDESALSPTWDYIPYNRVVTGLVVYGSGTLSSQASLSINPTWFRRARSTQSVVSSLVTNNIRVRYASSALTSSTSVSATISNRLRNIPAALTCSTSLNISAEKIKNVSASLITTATQVTNARKTAQAASVQQVTATQTATALRIKQIDSAFSAIATELAVVAKNATGTVLMESVSTVTAQVRKVTDEPQALTATSALVCTGVNTQFGSASLTSTFTESSQEIYLRRVEVNLSTQATLACTVSKFVGVTSEQQSTTTLSATTNNSRIRFASSNLAVQAQIVTNNMIVRLAQANMASQAQLTVFAGILVLFEADLQVTGFQVTVGQVINIDLYYQLTIEPERRTLLVLPESRSLTIDSETRVNIIKGY
jgi:hypothetical protein